MKVLFSSYWKSLILILVILYLSLVKPATINELNVFKLTDKISHYLAYVVFGVVLIFDYIKQSDKNSFTELRFWLICIIFPVLFGGLIEILQETFFKPRTAEWLDWACDFAGIGTSYLIMRFLHKKTRYF